MNRAAEKRTKEAKQVTPHGSSMGVGLEQDHDVKSGLVEKAEKKNVE
jgi:hypothetical protein